MSTPIAKNFASPDDTRPMPNGKSDIVNLGGVSAIRMTFEPGWKWSESAKPIVGTDSCPVHHIGYQVSGRLHVQWDDGTELEVGPGDVYDLPPGHDAWVIDNEPAVLVDFRGVETHTEPQR